MSKVHDILEMCYDVCQNPKREVKSYIEQNGSKAIGCFPVYCPEEIVHAAGMLPVGIWGAEMEVSEAKKYFPAFYSSIFQTSLELGIKGEYDDLSGVIFPINCDQSRCASQNWKFAVKNIELIPLSLIQNRRTPAGLAYMRPEYERILEKMEQISGREITDQDLFESIAVYNRHRATMREFVKIAPDYPTIITPVLRNAVIKSGFFMEKSKHELLVSELISELTKEQEPSVNGPRVVLSGILADSEELLDIFRQNNITIVGDDLAQESRQFRTDVPNGDDPINCLAIQYTLLECSTLYSPENVRAQMILDLVKEQKADGVIICLLKFYDPEEYDYPLINNALKANGIPSLVLEIDQQMKKYEQSRTAIQTFAEMLS